MARNTKNHPGWRTAADTFAVLAAGQESPWTAVGNFLDGFYAANREEKAAWIADPLPKAADPEKLCWAAFLAATVDWLAHPEGITCPAWVRRPEYVLREPWFLYPGIQFRAWLLTQTPPPFKARNIFCGNRALDRV